MLAALPQVLPGGARWTRPAGGMLVWAELPAAFDALALLRVAVEEGVAFVPGAEFFADAEGPSTMRLSFATLAPDQIVEALRRLRAAFVAVGDGVRGDPPDQLPGSRGASA